MIVQIHDKTIIHNVIYTIIAINYNKVQLTYWPIMPIHEGLLIILNG